MTGVHTCALPICCCSSLSRSVPPPLFLKGAHAASQIGQLLGLVPLDRRRRPPPAVTRVPQRSSGFALRPSPTQGSFPTVLAGVRRRWVVGPHLPAGSRGPYRRGPGGGRMPHKDTNKSLLAELVNSEGAGLRLILEVVLQVHIAMT